MSICKHGRRKAKYGLERVYAWHTIGGYWGGVSTLSPQMEHVLPTQVLPTPMPMSTNPSSQAEIGIQKDYKDQVNGILPGYSGHVPRARDKYSAASTGSIAPERIR